MDVFIVGFAEVFLMGVLYLSLRKGALMPFPDFAILYMAFMELILYLQVSGAIDYRFLSSYSSYSFEKNFGILSLMICTYSLFLYVSKYRSTAKLDYAKIFSNISIPGGALTGIAIFLYLHLFAFLMTADLGLVWKNETYLLMASNGVMRVKEGLGTQLVLLLSPIALTCSSLFFLLYLKRDPAWRLFFPVFVWWFLYQLGAHSRVTVLMLGVGLFLSTFLGRRGIAATLGVAMVICLVQALAGRGGDYHGISQVGNVFYYAYLGVTENIDSALGNPAEGIFVTSELLVSQPNASMAYRLLSFSPLVNAIDGFQNVMMSDGIRLSAYVPMSAIHEVVAFGVPFVLFYFGVQFYCIRVTTRYLATRPGLLSVFLNLAGMFGFAQQFAYPVRNSFRWFIYPVIVTFFL